MNQGKVTNELPKLRYCFMSENIGLPKEREFYGNGVSILKSRRIISMLWFNLYGDIITALFGGYFSISAFRYVF